MNTSFCKGMTFVLSSIVEVSLNKTALRITICANDWTAERAIIASIYVSLAK